MLQPFRRFLPAALAAALLAAPAHADGKCQRYRLASLEMTLEHFGVPQIPITVNSQTLNAIIDTGGIDSVLSWEAVERLNLPKKRLEVDARVYDVNGQAMEYSTTADEFHIGAMFGKNWPFLVARPHLTGNKPIDAVISPDILAQYDIEFDFAAGTFNLFTHDECPGRVAYWSTTDFGALPFTMDGYHMIAHATLDGEAIDVEIDTGSTLSFMTDKVAREIDLDPDKMKPIEDGRDASHARRYHQAKVLELSGIRIDGPEFEVIPEHNAALDNMSRSRPTVVLGTSVLQKLHLYIAYREKVLYFTRAEDR